MVHEQWEEDVSSDGKEPLGNGRSRSRNLEDNPAESWPVEMTITTGTNESS
jgi:hypothetical protein